MRAPTPAPTVLPRSGAQPRAARSARCRRAGDRRNRAGAGSRSCGCVAACGLVASDKLPTTVYPFILRGVTLAGIDSAKCPREPRLEIWKKLATEWNVIERLQPLVREVTLGDVPREVDSMLAGQNQGRILVLPR